MDTSLLYVPDHSILKSLDSTSLLSTPIVKNLAKTLLEVVELHVHPVTEKRSQYTFPHIFSKRGTILTIFAVLVPQ